MTGLDLTAATAAALASAALAVRSIMLNPTLPSWCDAPCGVRLALMLGASVWGGTALSIARLGGASARETLGLIVSAALSGVLLVNLWRQRRNGSDD